MSWGLGSLGKAIEDNFSPAGLEQRRAVRSATDFNNKLIGDSTTVWNKAQALADRPYQAYEGQRIADLSPNEQQGMNLASTEGQVSGEYYAKAGNLADEMANNSFSGDTISKYMNPYTENVTDKAIKNINLGAAQNLNNLRGQAASRGAFGDTRQAMLESGAERSRLNSIGDVTAENQAKAYDSAVSTWKDDNQRRSAAIDAYRSVGNDVTKMNSQQVSDLMMTGGADRVLQQMKLDTNYQTFLDKQNWDVNNFNFLVQALGAERGNTSSPYGLPQGGNNAGMALGALSSLIGMWGKNKGTNVNVNTSDSSSWSNNEGQQIQNDWNSNNSDSTNSEFNSTFGSGD